MDQDAESGIEIIPNPLQAPLLPPRVAQMQLVTLELFIS
jgi:hypothetical protein